MCIVSLFIDPPYFYLPYVGGPACISTGYRASDWISYSRTFWISYSRTFNDLFYLFHIVMKFHARCSESRVLSRGEIVMDSAQIAMKYLKSRFVVDLAAFLRHLSALVPSWSYSLPPKVKNLSSWKTWCNCCSLLCRNPRVLVYGSSRVSWKRKQGFKGEENRSEAFALQLAICRDEELYTLIKGTIAGCGVIPHIHKSSINNTTKE